MKLKPNPAWEGKKPSPGGKFCHDGTPFLSVECRCGDVMHIHESQVDDALANDADAIGARCPTCSDVLVLGASELKAAIREAWGDAYPEASERG